VSRYSFISKRISIVTVLILAAVYFSGINSVPFHPDESQWIATSDVFEKYVSGQFSSPVWNQSYWTLTQPPMTRFVIGIGRRLGGFTPQELNPHWQFELDEETNIANGAMPSESLLWWSRFPMVTVSIFSILIGWALVNKSFGRFAGVIWISLCVINSYFLTTLRRAMGEAPLLFWVVLSVYASYQILQQANTDERSLIKPTIWIGIFGIIAGLAGTAKLNGLSVLAAGAVIVVIVAIQQKQTLYKKLVFIGCAGMTMLLLAGCSFVGSNPFLWRNPIGRTQQMLDHRLAEMEKQQTQFVEYQIDSASKRMRVVPKEIFQTNAALNRKGMLPFNIALFVIGLFRAVLIIYKGLMRKLPDSAMLAILLVGFSVSLPTLFTPLNWGRYYLLPVYFSTVFIVVGVNWIVAEMLHGLWGMRRILYSSNV